MMKKHKKKESYTPIDCHFYDYLLECATLKKCIKITYFDLNNRKEIESIILDVYTKSGVEYLLTSCKTIIQLDHLVSVGIRLNNSNGCVITK